MKRVDQQILQLALPSIVSNITVPLLGMIDVAITGHIGDASYIAAISVGSMIFNMIYWIFAFLRMGTSGLTAQARGQRNEEEQMNMLVRSLSIAVGFALVMIVLQWPVKQLLFWLMSPTEDVAPLASSYFSILIWGAPATLGMFSLAGWYVGMQNTRIPMLVSIVQNVVNILASLLLVFGLGMKVEGVATGTLIAQYAGLLIGLFGLRKMLKGKVVRSLKGVYQRDAMVRFFKVNRDIFIRTIFIASVNFFFTSAGARQGAVILAVNTILIQLYMLFSYFMDGFANAGEALSGLYYGAQMYDRLKTTIRRLFVWGAMMVFVFTLAYVFLGPWFVRLLTSDPEVLQLMPTYQWWSWLVPVTCVAAFIWDGVFIGLTRTRGMLISSMCAAICFFAIYYFLSPVWHNHALWLAMLCYMVVRGAVQTILFT